jgi:large subunit ribosomal protein L25
MNIKVEAQNRSKGKKSDMTTLRSNGMIPAIVYSDGKEGKMISLPKMNFMKEYKKTYGHMAFFDINIDDEIIRAILKDKQIHPVTREILHIDFQELHKGKLITIKVPLRFIGTAPGTKAGGLLEVLHRDLEIECLPKDIPDEIEVDISKLDLGSVIHLGDVDLGTLQTKLPSDTTIVTIHVPRAIAEKAEEKSEPETV